MSSTQWTESDAMLQARQEAPPKGPPYFNYKIAMAGGLPTPIPDIPIDAVLIVLYGIGAACNMAIFQANRKIKHKFHMSWAMFGFCMSRVGTQVLRIVWATRPNNPRIAIAALIFTNLGVLIVYMVVLMLSQRIFRATHPNKGWNKHLGKAFVVAYWCLLGAILCLIAFTILSFYTLDTTLRTVSLWMQRAVITYLMIFNVASLVLVAVSTFLPRAHNNENFGTRSIKAKLIILWVTLFFLIFLAGLRTATSWAPPHLATDTPWYLTKPAFYVILFGFELAIVYWFILTRFDKVFWVPNGSSKPGDYSQVDFDGSTMGNKSDGDKASDGDKSSEQEKLGELDNVHEV